MSTSKVELYIYDLTKGMASLVSPMLIGKRIDGIWHTSLVVYDKEWFFGSRGVETCQPGSTPIGEPLERLVLGETEIPYQLFISYIFELGNSTYAGSKYSLLQHNCNNFTDEVAQFLCGARIPQYILELPNEVLQTNLGKIVIPLIEGLEQNARPIRSSDGGNSLRAESPDYEQLNSQIEEARSRSDNERP